mmetsp:Transcript_76091/g.126823  ORF Transcript_76091/g.126823 Transcript_76091/m.126823 type:complete len:211 (+) Transcript_76091:462-1094(+)
MLSGQRPASWPCLRLCSSHSRRPPGLPKYPIKTAGSVAHAPGPPMMPITNSLANGLRRVSSGRKPRETPKRRPASPLGSANSSNSSGKSRSEPSFVHAAASPLTTSMQRVMPFSCKCGQKQRTFCAYSTMLKSAGYVPSTSKVLAADFARASPRSTCCPSAARGNITPSRDAAGFAAASGTTRHEHAPELIARMATSILCSSCQIARATK